MIRTLAAFLVAAHLSAGPCAAVPPRATILPTASVPLAMEWDWDWDGFKRYWRKQLGKTTGVVGSVALVVGIGVLIVMSARKKT
jgi:hypothetical protein